MFYSLTEPSFTLSDRILNTVSSCVSSLAQISRVKHAFDKKNNNFNYYNQCFSFQQIVLLFASLAKCSNY